MSQRKIGTFFVRTPRQNGASSSQAGGGQSPHLANGAAHHMQQHSASSQQNIQQSYQQQKQPQLRTPPGADQTPLCGQKRDALGMPIARGGSSDMQIDTPEQPAAPQRPPASSRQPEMLEARRRRMQATLSDPETKDAAALRSGQEDLQIACTSLAVNVLSMCSMQMMHHHQQLLFECAGRSARHSHG